MGDTLAVQYDLSFLGLGDNLVISQTQFSAAWAKKIGGLAAIATVPFRDGKSSTSLPSAQWRAGDKLAVGDLLVYPRHHRQETAVPIHLPGLWRRRANPGPGEAGLESAIFGKIDAGNTLSVSLGCVHC